MFLTGDVLPRAPLSVLRRNLPEPVCPPNELNGRTLIRVGRKEYLSEGCPEGIHSTRATDPFEKAHLALVQAHAVPLVQVDKPGVECAMVGRRECDAICYVIRASGRSNGEYMCSVNEAQLYPR